MPFNRPAPRMEIVCDTDFLMKIVNDPLPKFNWKSVSNENEFVTLRCVVRELKGLLSSRSQKTSNRARNTIRAIESGIVKVESSENESEEVDYALLEFVRSNATDRLLATLDGSLLSRLEKIGLGYFTLSSGKPLFRLPKQQRI